MPRKPGLGLWGRGHGRCWSRNGRDRLRWGGGGGGPLRAGLRHRELGRLGFAKQFRPLDGGAYTQRQQGDSADADRQVDQPQLARDHTRDEQPDRDHDEKRTETITGVLPAVASASASAYRRSREGAPSVVRKPPECCTTSGTPY